MANPEAWSEYPPSEHVLRDLAVAWELHPDPRGTAWLTPTPHLAAPSGAVRPGVLATVVDMLAGGLTASAVRPDWIATADLTLHLLPRPPAGDVAAVGQVVRKGRTTAVTEVELSDPTGPLGLATLTFAVLARRDGNPVFEEDDGSVRVTLAPDGPPLDRSIYARAGITIDDRGVTTMPVHPYVRNSLGAVQGGVIASVVDVAASHAATAASGQPMETVDLFLTYLRLAREGPVRAHTTVLARDERAATVRVELEDAGAGKRTTLALARTVVP